MVRLARLFSTHMTLDGTNHMNIPLERTIVKRIFKELKENRSSGGFWFKVHGSPLQIAGVPDIIGCYRGRFVAFEVKRSEVHKPTQLQIYQINRIRRAGGVALPIHSVEEAIAILDRIDRSQEAKGGQS